MSTTVGCSACPAEEANNKCFGCLRDDCPFHTSEGCEPCTVEYYLTGKMFKACAYDSVCDAECCGCGIRDCPYKEELHYHHDGCPSCYSAMKACPSKDVLHFVEDGCPSCGLNCCV
jgi:hypothetical protein